MPVNDFFTNGQTHAAPFKFVVAVQPFEYHKNLIGIFWIETNSVVLDNHTIEIGPRFIINTNYRHLIFFTEFNGIAQQVLKKLSYLAWDSPNLRKIAQKNLRR